MTDEPYEIDEDSMYFFTCLVENQYRTVFVGWLRPEMIQQLKSVKPGSSYAHIVMTVGENTFICNIGAPLYLLNYENDDIFDFAGDQTVLDLYPSGNIPDDLDMETVIDFPSYFEKDVEPLIDYKLFDKFYAQENGIWVPIDI